MTSKRYIVRVWTDVVVHEWEAGVKDAESAKQRAWADYCDYSLDGREAVDAGVELVRED